MMSFNHTLAELMNQWVYVSPKFTTIVAWIADRLDTWVIIFLLLWFLRYAWRIHRGSHKLICLSCFHPLVMTIITGISAWGIARILKALFALPRPFLTLGLDITPVFTYGGFDSFPSGHAALFMALALMTWFHDRTVGVIAFICALVIGIGRIMVGIHFPMDILAGYIVGALFVLVVVLLFDRQHLHKK